MLKKIFRSSFITSLVVLLVSMILILGVLFEYFEAQTFKELKSEAEYIGYALENEGITYLDHFQNKNKRITLVAEDGKVMADTLADADVLTNHGDRQEIREALREGTGQSVRYSRTWMQKTMYYAVKMENGTVLRVSTTQNSIVVILVGLLQPLLIVVLIALCLSFFISRQVSKGIIKPINNLDLEYPANNEVYEELTPLLRKIAGQKKTIEQQIRDARQKQEEFRLITENMREGLLVIDTKENVLSHNQAALRLLDIDKIKGNSVLAYNRTKEFREAVNQALAGHRAEDILYVDDKTYNLIVSPVYDTEKLIGAVIVIIDVTESVKREQLRREFTSNVSHELKTPLTSISGFAEMLKAGDMPGDMVVDFSNSIYEEAQRLIALVSDIIKISELDEGKIPYEKEKVDLVELSREVTERLNSVAKKRNINLHVIGEHAYVMGIRKILDEIIYNLCDNAIKYNKENGAVDIILNTTEDKVTLMVRDTGIGIPLADQSRVFERFYRVDKSHSKLVGGTGLGLAIVKHGAVFHDAVLSLESVEGEGTKVTVGFQKYCEE